MVYLVFWSERCSKTINPVGYKSKLLNKFNKKYPNIPQLMLKTGVPLSRKIWVMGMFFRPNGYRLNMKHLFSGTLLGWFQKYFLPYYIYDEKWNYTSRRSKRKN